MTMSVHARCHIGAVPPTLLAGFLGLCIVTTDVAAQEGAETAPAFVDPSAGDCTIVVRLPNTIKPGELALELNSTRLTTRLGPMNPAVFELLEPLRYLDRLTGKSNSTMFDAEVGLSRDGSTPRASCVDDRSEDAWDERSEFDAAGFFGTVTDNFAATDALGYSNELTADNLTRRTVGLQTQYRLWAGRNGKRFWLVSNVLLGVRTADIDCNKTPQVIGCGDGLNVGALNPQEDFLFVLSHATTVEAHFSPRFEFLTLDRDSIAPMQLFMG